MLRLAGASGRSAPSARPAPSAPSARSARPAPAARSAPEVWACGPRPPGMRPPACGAPDSPVGRAAADGPPGAAANGLPGGATARSTPGMSQPKSVSVTVATSPCCQLKPVCSTTCSILSATTDIPRPRAAATLRSPAHSATNGQPPCRQTEGPGVSAPRVRAKRMQELASDRQQSPAGGPGTAQRAGRGLLNGEAADRSGAGPGTAQRPGRSIHRSGRSRSSYPSRR